MKVIYVGDSLEDDFQHIFLKYFFEDINVTRQSLTAPKIHQERVEILEKIFNKSFSIKTCYEKTFPDKKLLKN